MASFDPALAYVIEDLEGGWKLTNHSGDRGGQTFAGISRRANPDWTGWDLVDKGDRGSPELRRLAEAVYRERYWNPVRGSELPSDPAARAVLASSVDCGAETTIRLVQMTLGLKVDGVLGPATLGALRSIRPGSLEDPLFRSLFCNRRVARYSEIVRRRPKQRKWLRGWINRALKDAP